jgi:hypothetical protein
MLLLELLIEVAIISIVNGIDIFLYISPKTTLL